MDKATFFVKCWLILLFPHQVEETFRLEFGVIFTFSGNYVVVYTGRSVGAGDFTVPALVNVVPFEYFLTPAVEENGVEFGNTLSVNKKYVVYSVSVWSENVRYFE